MQSIPNEWVLNSYDKKQIKRKTRIDQIDPGFKKQG